MDYSRLAKVYVQTAVLKSFSDFLSFAKEQHCNIEVSTFAGYNVYEADWQRVLQQHKKQLSNFNGKISIHGVFQDIFIHSNDRKIAELSKNRVIESMEIAQELKACQIVFHGNFNPLVRYQNYVQSWTDRNASFWSELLDQFNIRILLENVWEPDPAIFRLLLDELNHSRFGVCFDIGHAKIYSRVSIAEWFSSLGKDISYIHLSDNSGEKDQHLAIAQGNIDWKEFSGLVNRYAVNPEIVLEVVTLEKTKQSLRTLMKNKIYPFDDTS